MKLSQVLFFWFIGLVTGVCGYYVAQNSQVFAAKTIPQKFVIKKPLDIDPSGKTFLVTPMLPPDLVVVQTAGAATLGKWDVLTCAAGTEKVGEGVGTDGKTQDFMRAVLRCDTGIVLSVRHLMIGE